MEEGVEFVDVQGEVGEAGELDLDVVNQSPSL